MRHAFSDNTHKFLHRKFIRESYAESIDKGVIKEGDFETFLTRIIDGLDYDFDLHMTKIHNAYLDATKKETAQCQERLIKK